MLTVELVQKKADKARDFDYCQLEYDQAANKLIVSTLDSFSGVKSNEETRKAAVENTLTSDAKVFALARLLLAAKRDYQEASDLLEVEMLLAKLQIANLGAK